MVNTQKPTSQSEIINLFKRYSKLISTESKLDSAESQRHLYYHILKNIAKTCEFDLPFKIKEYEKNYHSLKQFDFPYDVLLKKSELLDRLFEEIDVEYRRKLGQILTPIQVANFMVSLGLDEKKSVILDPAIGTGIFPNSILLNIKNTSKLKISGFDKDPLVLNATYCRIKMQKPNFDNLVLNPKDFLLSKEDKLFGFIICNPPYLNFHDFDNKASTTFIEKKFGIKISKLTNIYSLFFIAASKHLEKDGKMVFITPSEFFYTGYGETLKKFLLDNFTLVGFVVFDFSETLFDGILTTAVITYLEKKKPSKSHKVNFVKIKKWPENNSELAKILVSGKSTNPDYVLHSVPQADLDPLQKWLIYFEPQNHKNISDKLVPLSKIGAVNRGIATGDNKFFTLSKKDLDEWKIEEKFVRPVLARAQYAKKFIFTKSDWGKLVSEGKKAYLLYCFEKPSKILQKYIDFGEQTKVHERYLCSHRKPWFSMERGKPAPILALVFNRENVRFVLNEADILNLTAYHGIYLNFDDELMTKALLCYLNSDTCGEIQRTARREYGGGLHKFEPGDLEKLLVIDVTKLKKPELKEMAVLFDELCLNNNKKIKEKIDSTIKQIIL